MSPIPSSRQRYHLKHILKENVRGFPYNVVTTISSVSTYVNWLQISYLTEGFRENGTVSVVS